MEEASLFISELNILISNYYDNSEEVNKYLLIGCKKEYERLKHLLILDFKDYVYMALAISYLEWEECMNIIKFVEENYNEKN